MGAQSFPADTADVEQQELARLALAQTREIIGLFDTEGTLRACSRAFVELSQSRISDRLREAIARAAKGETVRCEAEAHDRIIELSLLPVRDEAQRVVFVLAEGRDITDEKALERELAHKNLELERLLERIHELVRAKEEFLAMLGHELRNPLSPILTALHLMKLQGPEGSERARHVIERQVKHLTRLVDDLLDVSRISRGSVELKIKVIEIADVVAMAIEMASPLLEQRTHTLSVNVPRHGLRVNGDPGRLGQVVANLLTNAAKYTSPGGHITIVAEQQDQDVVLCVRDNGVGIAPETLPCIFDLFVQGRQAIDRSQGGLGIGLTIVRSLVERHGGSVSAHSDGRGRGSEFVVRLPRVEQPSDMARPSSPGVTPSNANGRRILVVDDNEDGAEMLAEGLSQKGYDTRVAHDGPSALRLAAEFFPDIAVLDIGLPVMDGYELAAHLRSIPGLGDVRLIAVTGYGQESDRQKTRLAGFHDHLVKPVHVETLEAYVRRHVAEEEGFEPPVPSRVRRFSKPVP